MEGYLPADYEQLVMRTLLYNVGLGRPKINLELCRFVMYSYVKEKRGIRVFTSIHLFRTNFMDMPHRIWRKISNALTKVRDENTPERKFA